MFVLYPCHHSLYLRCMRNGDCKHSIFSAKMVLDQIVLNLIFCLSETCFCIFFFSLSMATLIQSFAKFSSRNLSFFYIFIRCAREIKYYQRFYSRFVLFSVPSNFLWDPRAELCYVTIFFLERMSHMSIQMRSITDCFFTILFEWLKIFNSADEDKEDGGEKN